MRHTGQLGLVSAEQEEPLYQSQVLLSLFIAALPSSEGCAMVTKMKSNKQVVLFLLMTAAKK